MEQKTYEIHEGMIRSELPFIFNCQKYRSYGRTVFTGGNWHHNLEFLYFLQGEGLVYCNGMEYQVRPGCLIAVNSNELHSLLSEKGMQYYCLIVDAAFLSDNGIPVESVCFASFICDEGVGGLFQKIAEEFSGDGLFRRAAIRAGVLELLVYLARNHAVPAKKYPKTDENIKQVIGYLHGNAAEAISLESIAEKFNLNKSHLARIFKKATGMTVVSYLNMVRCENAKRLLLHRDLPVSEVARRCGFENASYFAKTFCRFVGCLPSDFRQQHKRID